MSALLNASSLAVDVMSQVATWDDYNNCWVPLAQPPAEVVISAGQNRHGAQTAMNLMFEVDWLFKEADLEFDHYNHNEITGLMRIRGIRLIPANPITFDLDD